MTFYYLDTCIWRDFYENRVSKSGTPLGKYASLLFMKILKNKDHIIFSHSLITELRKSYTDAQIHERLDLFLMTGLLIFVEITNEEYAEAKELSEERKIPFGDCLNAVQARNHNAILVSQDKHFFENLTDIVKAVRPQELI